VPAPEQDRHMRVGTVLMFEVENGFSKGPMGLDGQHLGATVPGIGRIGSICACGANAGCCKAEGMIATQ